MAKKSSVKKDQESTKDGPPSGGKKVGYRTPKSFRRQTFRRNPALTTQRPRSLGGHQ